MNRDFAPAVYILASKRNGTLYTGVTSNLPLRIYQHRIGNVPGFTRDFGVKMLVWFEQHATMEDAILREKRIKKWNRAWKLERIEAGNPDCATLRRIWGLNPSLDVSLGSRFRGNDERGWKAVSLITAMGRRRSLAISEFQVGQMADN